MTRAALLSLPLLIALLGAAPPPVLPPDLTDAAMLRFQVNPSDRMTVPISFANGAPHQFMIDTGAEQSAISTELARAMKFASRGERRVFSFAGERRVPMVRIPSLSFNNRTHRSVDALTFRRGALGADGLLGIDSLVDQQVKFDFKRRTLAISNAPKWGSQPLVGDVRVRAALRDGRLIMSRASANRVQIEVILDTGTSVSMGNLALRRELERTHRVGPLRRISMLAITGEVVEIDYGLLREVVIQRTIVIQRMPIAFAVSQPFDQLGMGDRPAMLMGMDVLRSFGAVTVDFRNRKVTFQPRDDSQRRPAARFGFTSET